MDIDDFSASWGTLGVVLLAGAGAYLAVIALSRITGPRSLAAMSSFDFAATVAIGSTLSSTLLGSVPLASGAVGLSLLFGLQYVIAKLRRRGALAGLADNQPILLMAGEEILEDNLRHVRLSLEELLAQLRGEGIVRLSEVRAAVMETSGSVSVLRHGQPIDPELLRGVRGAERVVTAGSEDS